MLDLARAQDVVWAGARRRTCWKVEVPSTAFGHVPVDVHGCGEAGVE
jgi:hypothetical protein